MRHEGVGYSLLGSDTAICGISVEGKAESQRSHIGDTEGFIGTQRHGDTENIIKFSEDTVSSLELRGSAPHFPLPYPSPLPCPFPQSCPFPLPCMVNKRPRSGLKAQ